MASSNQKHLPVMINCTVALEGSKRHFAGLDTLPKNFEQLDEAAQAKELEKAAKVGEKRKAAAEKLMDELKAKGQEIVLTIDINGQKVSGKVDWNSAETGLRARVNLGGTTAEKSVAKATASKLNKQRMFLGLTA